MTQRYCAKVRPVFHLQSKTRSLCVTAYPGHPRGCPNYDKKAGCPPNTIHITNTLDLEADVYAIWNAFDVGAHAARLLQAHPKWSDRQLYCYLYWQGTARRQLRDKIESFLRDHPDLHIITCPEAHSVNVTKTMAQAGIALEWPPRRISYQVVLAGTQDQQGGTQTHTGPLFRPPPPGPGPFRFPHSRIES